MAMNSQTSKNSVTSKKQDGSREKGWIRKTWNTTKPPTTSSRAREGQRGSPVEGWSPEQETSSRREKVDLGQSTKVGWRSWGLMWPSKGSSLRDQKIRQTTSRSGDRNLVQFIDWCYRFMPSGSLDSCLYRTMKHFEWRVESQNYGKCVVHCNIKPTINALMLSW